MSCCACQLACVRCSECSRTQRTLRFLRSATRHLTALATDFEQALTPTHDAPRIASRRARGFTLVELLVVLTILGLSGAAIALTLPDEGARLRQDSERLAAYLGHARDEAILTLRTVEVVASARGYEVRREDHGRWQPLTDKPFRARTWEDGVRTQLPRGQAQVSVRFDPTGMAEPRTLQLAMGTRKARVQVAADGQVSVDASAH